MHKGGQAIFDLFVTLNPILLPEAKICVYLAMRNQCTCGKASHGIMVEACPDCGASSARIVGLKTFGLNYTRQGRGKAWATKTRLKAQPTSSKPNECPNGARAGPDLPINKSPDSAPAVGQESTSWSVLVLSSLFFFNPLRVQIFSIPDARTAIQRKGSCSRIEDWIYSILSWDIFRCAGCLIGLNMQG